MTSTETKTAEQRQAFIRAFGESTGCSNMTEADDQWSGWSRQLSDSELAEIESGGEESGHAEAEKYLETHPLNLGE